MTDPLKNAAGEIVDPARDRPGLVLGTLVAATLAGTSAVMLVLWTVRTVLAGAAASDRPVTTGPAFFILMLGTLGAIALASVLGWWRLRPLTSSWRRGVFAMIAGFGTIVAALLATAVDHYYGRNGLVSVAIGSGALALLLLLAGRARA